MLYRAGFKYNCLCTLTSSTHDWHLAYSLLKQKQKQKNSTLQISYYFFVLGISPAMSSVHFYSECFLRPEQYNLCFIRGENDSCHRLRVLGCFFFLHNLRRLLCNFDWEEFSVCPLCHEARVGEVLQPQNLWSSQWTFGGFFGHLSSKDTLPPVALRGESSVVPGLILTLWRPHCSWEFIM